ncbi:hypothetical protein ACFX2J_038120 [Malus domestica]
MVHNGIKYGNMQLILEPYDVLKNVGRLMNKELSKIFLEWNRGELESFLTGMKGTRKWTVQQVAELSVAAPTIAASLDYRAKSVEKGWNLNLGELAQIWKGRCIIRAVFLDQIKNAYQMNQSLPNLIVNPDFAKKMMQRQAAWKRVVRLAVAPGISTPGMCASLSYFDTYRQGRLPANLVQAQKDLFGAHTYERVDRPGAFHIEWTKLAQKSGSGVGALY